MKVALLQYPIAWADKATNLRLTEERIAALAGQADVAVLPEMFATGFCTNHPELAETMDGEIMTTLQRLADQYDEVMVHPDDVLNYDLLEKIEDKERHILLVNEYCIRHCPLRPYHYSSLSEMSLDYFGYDGSDFDKRQNTNGCNAFYARLTENFR